MLVGERNVPRDPGILVLLLLDEVSAQAQSLVVVVARSFDFGGRVLISLGSLRLPEDQVRLLAESPRHLALPALRFGESEEKSRVVFHEQRIVDLRVAKILLRLVDVAES